MGLICKEQNILAAIVGTLPFLPMRPRTSGGPGHTSQRPCQLLPIQQDCCLDMGPHTLGSHPRPDLPHRAPPCSLVVVSPLTLLPPQGVWPVPSSRHSLLIPTSSAGSPLHLLQISIQMTPSQDDRHLLYRKRENSTFPSWQQSLHLSPALFFSQVLATF